MSTALRFELTTPVADDRPVYVSGNFCDWYPDLEAFRLQPTEPGQYVLTLPSGLSLPSVLEYKYTRGGWDHVELDAAGDTAPNRITRRKKGVLHDTVPHWRWFGQSFNPDYFPILAPCRAAISVPQLKTRRRARVLLPYDYAQTDKRYPVLYLNDGQNLIGAGSEYGSWEVDRRLAVLASRQHHDVIVVAIDHAGEKRIQEFTPDRTIAGTGDGRNYLDFVTKTLKPLIDKTFRTKPEAATTGIGGSSMGGLISLYAGLLHPDVFGRLLVFSPSLWIAPTVYDDARALAGGFPAKWYLYGGVKESKHMVSSIKQFANALAWNTLNRQIDVQVSIDPKGQHSESFWGHEFPNALEWLFY